MLSENLGLATRQTGKDFRRGETERRHVWATVSELSMLLSFSHLEMMGSGSGIMWMACGSYTRLWY